MLELLNRADTRPTAALAQCRRALARRWKRFGVAHALLPSALRDDLVALFAWHELVRTFDDGERGFTELDRALEETYSQPPTSSIAAALRQTVHRFDLSALSFRRALEERSRARETGTFESRDALLRHARRIAHPEALAYLRVLGHTGEREETLAKALAEGMQLAAWTVHVERDVARGRLHFAVDDLSANGIDLFSLRSGTSGERWNPLVRAQVAWARQLLAKGWPLCHELGPWRGRQLAWFLRWHAATLAALEARGYDTSRGELPAGWLRVLACTVTALAWRGSPARAWFG